MIDDDTVKNLENLHRLKTEGVISEADFEQAKAQLLSPARSASQRATPQIAPAFDGVLPADDDHIAWILLPLRRYADFNGRSCRKEFWMFQLVVVALFIVSAIFAGMEPNLGIGVFLLGLLGLFIPQLAAQVRRFHDQDKSGWFALMNLIPYIGGLIVLIFMLVEGTRGDNQYGPDPIDRES